MAKESYALFTLTSVVDSWFSGTKSWFTIVTEACVFYINGVYFGLDKKVSDPFWASSIFESWKTSTLGSPSTVPSSWVAICWAVNFIVVKIWNLS